MLIPHPLVIAVTAHITILIQSQCHKLPLHELCKLSPALTTVINCISMKAVTRIQVIFMITKCLALAMIAITGIAYLAMGMSPLIHSSPGFLLSSYECWWTVLLRVKSQAIAQNVSCISTAVSCDASNNLNRADFLYCRRWNVSRRLSRALVALPPSRYALICRSDTEFQERFWGHKQQPCRLG